MKQLILKNDVQQLPLLVEFIDTICEEKAFDPAVSFNLNLALEEAVSNVMLYAYPKDEQHDIWLTADWDGQMRKITFELKDEGMAFNPLEQAPEVDITLGVDEREIGGLGIFLVEQIMEEVEYERCEDCNILTMRKSIPMN